MPASDWQCLPTIGLLALQAQPPLLGLVHLHLPSARTGAKPRGELVQHTKALQQLFPAFAFWSPGRESYLMPAGADLGPWMHPVDGLQGSAMNPQPSRVVECDRPGHPLPDYPGGHRPGQRGAARATLIW